MELLTRPASIALLAGAITTALIGIPPLAAALFVGWIGYLAFAASKGAQERRTEVAGQDMDPESRTLFRPLRKLHEAIEEIVRQNPDSATIKVLGQETLQESRQILSQVAHALEVREGLKRSLRGRYEAEKSIEELTELSAGAATSEEKASLLSAVEARKSELGHYQEIESNIAKIVGIVRQAEAALSELKARFAVTASGEIAAHANDDDLRETLARLKAIRTSVDEVEEMVRE